MPSGQAGFAHSAYRNSSGLVISAIYGQCYKDCRQQMNNGPQMRDICATVKFLTLTRQTKIDPCERTLREMQKHLSRVTIIRGSHKEPLVDCGGGKLGNLRRSSG
jgi:hypothetical protein